MLGSSHFNSINWLLGLNKSGTSIPPNSICTITGAQMKDGLACVEADKPGTSFKRLFLVSGPTTIPAGSLGRFFPGPEAIVKYGNSLSASDEIGPVPNQWTPEVHYPSCMTVVGSLSNSLYLVRVHPIDTVIGKLTQDLTYNGSATVDIWYGAGHSEAVISAGNYKITAYPYLMKSGARAIPSGKKVKCDFINGVWYATAAECY